MEVDHGNQQLQEPKPVVPDLLLPRQDDIVLIQRREDVREPIKARWTGINWIFQVAYQSGEIRWIQETPEEGTYEELEDQPSEEPIQAVSRTP